MKVLTPAVVFALCAAARGTDRSEGQGPTRTLAAAAELPRRLAALMLAVQREDPAHPVAAAATDPNEAAMRIKPQDLLPSDRPALHPDSHRAQRPSRDEDGDDYDSGSRRSRGTSGDTGKDQRPQAKDNRGLAKSGKDKKTHTGIDGKEVDDDNSDGDGNDMDAARKKAQQVKHIQARQRTWRTGKPTYNYTQALDGWKEVGPMYYYKGKYANAAAQRVSLALPAAAVAAAYVVLLH
ncbi:hypothetical protein IWQ56_004734 [Coemansia nantahalensis]|nr:hypothetical protein IWQ56_004734 [Coemansia nantahalensis]